MELEDAAVSRGGRSIWKGVTLRVEPGEYVAVLGPNGVGKSTLIQAILGLLPLAAGSLEVFGRPPHEAASLLGYLPQRHSFDSSLRLRARDLVRLGLDGNRWGLPLPFAPGNREIARRVDEVLEVVGAAAYAGRPVGELSGGEQQRILIARALVRSPRMLLMDEPLESLDLGNQQAISSLARDICRTEGVTVIMVAHDVNPILGDLDRVIYMAGGSAVIGRPEEVITSEKLSALYNAHIEVLRTSDGRLFVVGQQPEAISYHAHD
ncbi:MAG TPA: metal ABC transporter ATP-binding protein [Chloroflexi bacterium]|nr:metal ABC transporter ATP-binding protein [Chloroflexota bacterium]HAF20950.1 metal ABC transporter ATP-binding protein [Chloroflexota bacterium]